MVRPARLAAVGLGSWAQVLARAAERSQLIEITNCYTRSAERRRDFKEQFDIPRAAESYAQLLADDEVEGILVTTPNDTHKPVVLQALEAEKAVFVEKPIAHTMKDALEIGGAVEESGRILAVGHSARRLGGVRVMRQWVDRGELGKPCLAEANFSTGRGLQLPPEAWRAHPDRGRGGALIQLGIHHVDSLHYLLGPIRSVGAHARTLHTTARISDTVVAILEFEAGSIGYLGTSWTTPARFGLTLQGTDANVAYDLDLANWTESHRVDTGSTLRARMRDQSTDRRIELPSTDMFREELEEFALAIRGENSVEVGAPEAIRALAVVHAALTSSNRNGRAVLVAEAIHRASG